MNDKDHKSSAAWDFVRRIKKVVSYLNNFVYNVVYYIFEQMKWKNRTSINGCFSKNRNPDSVKDGIHKSNTNAPYTLAHKIFKVPLTKLNEKQLSTFMMSIMRPLYKKGPDTVYIFRTPGNMKEINTIINNIEENKSIDIESIHISNITSVLKQFLKNLPDCLLMCRLYANWREFHSLSDHKEKLRLTKDLLEKLPYSHYYVLKLLVAVLQSISKNSTFNQMSAKSLGICIEPSCLWPSSELEVSWHEMKCIGNLFAFFITECTVLFGTDVSSIFNEEQKDESKNTMIIDAKNIIFVD